MTTAGSMRPAACQVIQLPGLPSPTAPSTTVSGQFTWKEMLRWRWDYRGLGEGLEPYPFRDKRSEVAEGEAGALVQTE